MSIPRIFHHIWVSGDEMPEAVLAARQTWIDHHPEWEFRVWLLEDLRWLRNQALFDRAVPYSQKADFARYEVMHRFGGVYLDTDLECLRPIDPLLNGYRFFSGREPSRNVAAGIFGATPGHPIMREVIERLPASCLVYPADQLSYTTGPMILNRVLRDGAWEGRPDVRIFPTAYFYPYAGGEPWRRHEAFPRAYAVHHWGHSWKGQVGVSPRLSDLMPRQGEAVVPSARALWREASDRAATIARHRLSRRLLWPAKRSVRAAAHRVIPTFPTLHGVPWGPGEILVSTTSGTRLLCPNEDLSLSPELAIKGTHDRRFTDFLVRKLRTGMTFVDVGANVGHFAILAASRIGPGGRVFAYECNPELVDFLNRNVEMSWFDGRVRVIAKAAHRDDEERLLRVPRRQKMLGSLTHFEGPVTPADELQEFPVRCERLDVGLGDVPYIDLLKIDVEGSEADVLEGASGLLDDGKVGLIAMTYRDNRSGAGNREELDKQLARLVQERGATLHVPFASRSIPLDEVLTVCAYPHLLIRFRGGSIGP